MRHLKTQSTHTLKKMQRLLSDTKSISIPNKTKQPQTQITTKYHKVTENNYKNRQLKYIAFVFLAMGGDEVVVSESSPSCQKVIKYESL